MRWLVPLVLVLLAAPSRADTPIRCDNLSTADLAVDGLLDDWPAQTLARVGAPSDGAIALRCSWDGAALAIALELADDRVVRTPRRRHDDHVTVRVSAGGRPVVVDVFPGNAIARPKITKPAKVAVADSLLPRGFAVELLIPAKQLAGLTASTPSLALHAVFSDSDKAVGGDTIPLAIDRAIELGDRKDLMNDFLRAVGLKRGAITLDALADVDPDRRGAERVVAGGTVIGVLTDRFAYVTLPVVAPADVKQVELLAFGPRKTKVIAVRLRQAGNGGARELLALWTVGSGQLQALGQIEVRKQQGKNVLASTWKLVAGKRGPELHVEPAPAVGWTAATWNEEPAADADPILLPWDTTRGGVAYSVKGVELQRRPLRR